METILKEIETEIYRTANTRFNIFSAVAVRRIKKDLTVFEGIRLERLITAYRNLIQANKYTTLKNDKGKYDNGKQGTE